MKITTVQMDIRRGEQQANLRRLEELFESAEDIGDIAVLPELFTTGYLFDNPEDIRKLSEDFHHSPTLKTLQRVSQLRGCTVIAGVAERDQQQFFNSAVAVDSSGLRCRYRKMALSSVDQRYFCRGDQPVTFTCKGVTFGIAICLDLWYPELIRRYVEKDIDVLLHPANFGGDQTLHIARARAIENSMAIVTCNRVGTEKTKDIDGHYRGQSRIIDHTGKIISELGTGEEISTVPVTIDPGRDKQALGINLHSEISILNGLLDN